MNPFLTSLRGMWALVVLASALGNASPASAQLRVLTYSMGESIGFASAQAGVVVAALKAGDSDGAGKSHQGVYLNLPKAQEASQGILGSISRSVEPYEAFASCQKILQGVRGNHAYSEGSFDDPGRWVGIYQANVYDALVNARDCYTPALARMSPSFAHAYAMGANITIAEVHATLDERHRSTVVGALNVTKQALLNFNSSIGGSDPKLPVAQIDECIALASGSTPLREVQQRIGSVRNAYRASIVH